MGKKSSSDNSKKNKRNGDDDIWKQLKSIISSHDYDEYKHSSSAGSTHENYSTDTTIHSKEYLDSNSNTASNTASKPSADWGNDVESRENNNAYTEDSYIDSHINPHNNPHSTDDFAPKKEKSISSSTNTSDKKRDKNTSTDYNRGYDDYDEERLLSTNHGYGSDNNCDLYSNEMYIRRGRKQPKPVVTTNTFINEPIAMEFTSTQNCESSGLSKWWWVVLLFILAIIILMIIFYVFTKQRFALIVI